MIVLYIGSQFAEELGDSYQGSPSGEPLSGVVGLKGHGWNPCPFKPTTPQRGFPHPTLTSKTESAHRLAPELRKSGGQKEQVKDGQSNQHRYHRYVRELRNKCASQTFAGVNQRIHQHDLLKDRKVRQRTPRIISTAKKDHRRQNHAEHQSDMVLVNAATKGKSAAGGKKRHQHRNAGEAQRRA